MGTDPTYKRVLTKLAAFVGITIVKLQRDDNFILRQFLAMRLRKIWESFRWPDQMHIEKRFFQDGLWVAGSFNDLAIVFYDPKSKYYQNTSGGATAEEPTIGTDWVEVTEFRHFTPIIVAGQIRLGEVYNAWEADPRTTSFGTAREVSYELLTGDGIDFRPQVVDAPFLYFRERPFDYVGENFDNTISYVSGVEVFDEETGDYYVTNQAVAIGETPTTAAAKFDKESFPYRFEDYSVMGAYSDWLSQEERIPEASMWGNRATEAMYHEMRKLYRQQSQLPKTRIRTPQRPILGALSDTVTSVSA